MPERETAGGLDEDLSIDADVYAAAEEIKHIARKVFSAISTLSEGDQDLQDLFGSSDVQCSDSKPSGTAARR